MDSKLETLRPLLSPVPHLPTEKACTKCFIIKPLSEFHRDTRLKDGRRRRCRDCQRSAFAHWHTLNQEVRKEYWQSYYQVQGDKIKSRQKAAGRIWYQNNRNHVNAKSRSRKLANTEKAKESARKASLKYYEKNKSKSQARRRAWGKANPEKTRALNAKRRAHLFNNSVGAVDYQIIIIRDGRCCHICKETVDPADIHFDHVIPLSKGGAHSMDNIRIAHSKCNLRKGVKILNCILKEGLKS